jgi:hypothetical protein
MRSSDNSSSRILLALRISHASLTELLSTRDCLTCSRYTVDVNVGSLFRQKDVEEREDLISAVNPAINKIMYNTRVLLPASADNIRLSNRCSKACRGEKFVTCSALRFTKHSVPHLS